MPSRYRNWCFTSYAEEPPAPKDDCTYAIWGKETCPKTGRAHWQGYAEYKRAIGIKAAQRAAGVPGTTHFEARKGSQEQAIAYCKKDGDWKEYGTKKAQGKRSDLDNIQMLCKEGKTELHLFEEHFGSMVRYHKGVNRYRKMLQPKRTWQSKVYFLYGPPGTGKTRMAVAAGAEPVEFVNSFVQGYTNQEKVLFDDIDHNTFHKRESVLLKLLDRYPYTVNVKKGEAPWNPRVIYLTSNYSLEELFPNQMYRRAVKRRCYKIVRFNDLHIGGKTVVHKRKRSRATGTEVQK